MVFPKRVLTLTRRTCNAIYRNFDKVLVFCSALFFQQAPADVCMWNRSRVTVGFVKIVACTPPENERFRKKWTKKKWEEHIWKHGRCKRKVSTSFTIKKYASEHMEIMLVFRQWSRCKKENGCFDQTLHRKILCGTKKIKNRNDHSVEKGFPKWNFSWFDNSQMA